MSAPVCHPSSNASHEAIASWFLGPKAENHEYMRAAFDSIVQDLRKAREDYHPEDGIFITPAVQASEAFQSSIKKCTELLTQLSGYMAQHNIPFYSPRYNAHMNADTSMPGVLGYILTMMYNPNNVAVEASPLTSLIEYEVGQDLCEMLGYRRQPSESDSKKTTDPNEEPSAWGHITADGSIANLESMWVARNIKYYPLNLKDAIAPGAPFDFISDKLSVTTCAGEQKLLKDCTTWELLNLTSTAVLDLPGRLTSEFGMSTDYVQSVMQDYIIQTTSKEKPDKKYEIEQPPLYLVATTKHYSWPKGAAIAGIGSENLVEVNVDNHARMDCQHLEELLERCLKEQRAIYAVVAIIGSTEHGAVDPIDKVAELRTKFQQRGLSFMIHADAAWGGYFTSILRSGEIIPGRDMDPFVPKMTLLPYTRLQLEHIHHADSITIDPHKSGYIPYPAGSLCWRDERSRFMVTWTSPYIDFQAAGVQTMGTYGLEGSKPGAAPVAAWLSHEVIGLHKGGYGSLLGESMFTAVKMYCHWATMETPDLIVIPFNMLPSEMEPGATYADVEKEKQFIRDRIVNRPNAELVEDHEAMELVRKLGSDLMINAFSCNFRINGKVNTNVTEANVLNSRIYEALSVLKVDDDVKSRDLFVMSTQLSQKAYGECLTNFKRRLGLDGDEDLFILSNVSMSPFPTEFNFLATVADAFQKTASGIILNTCIPRNVVTPAVHSFIIQGTDKVHLVYLPLFQMATFAWQIIAAADFPPEVMDAYVKARADNPDATFLLHTSGLADIQDIVKAGKFRAVIDLGLPSSYSSITEKDHLIEDFEVSNLRVIKNRSLNSDLLEASYPSAMPFYLYGTRQQQHIDHILLCSPNVELCASEVTLDLDPDSGIYEPGFETELEMGLIAVLDNVRESTMQPFSDGNPPKFFAPGASFRVTLHRDSPKGPTAGILSSVLARGTITLGASVYRDYKLINIDPTQRNTSDNSVDVEELKVFVKGKTTPSEIGRTRPIPVVAPFGHTVVLDRFHQDNQRDDYNRTVAQRSAWKASWEKVVGRRA